MSCSFNLRLSYQEFWKNKENLKRYGVILLNILILISIDFNKISFFFFNFHVIYMLQYKPLVNQQVIRFGAFL